MCRPSRTEAAALVCVDRLVCDRAGAWLDVSSPVLVTPSHGAWQVQPFTALSPVPVLCTTICPVLCGCADEFCDSVGDAGALSALCSVGDQCHSVPLHPASQATQCSPGTHGPVLEVRHTHTRVGQAPSAHRAAADSVRWAMKHFTRCGSCRQLYFWGELCVCLVNSTCTAESRCALHSPAPGVVVQ